MRYRRIALGLLCLGFGLVFGPGPAIAQQSLEFKRLPAYARASFAIGELTPARRTGRIVITLPGGDVLRLIPRAEHRSIDGTWTTRASAGSDRLLVTTDGTRAYGHAVAGDRIYLIETIDGVLAVVDADRLGRPQPGPAGWRNDAVVDESRWKSGGGAGVAAAVVDSTAASTVDVAVFVEPAVETQYGSQAVRTRAQAWIDFTNEAFRLNAIPLSLRLVYLGPSTDPLPADATDDVFDAFSRSQAAIQVAQQYGADLRHLLYSQDARPSLDNCGRGALLGDVAVSGFEYGQHLFAHEIGHNFGAHHDRANVQPAGAAGAYNYGYVCGGRGTIMSYVGAGRVDHFSSPLLSFGGEPCGVAIGQPDAAFNGAVIELNRTRVESSRHPQATLGSVRFAQSTVGVEENGPATPFSIVRDGDLSRTASVEIGLIDGTATEGEDVRVLLQRVTFAPGESTRTLAIEPIDDEAFDAPIETLRAVLRYPLQLAVAGEPLQVDVTGGDDPDRGKATFNGSACSVRENAGIVHIQVSRIGATSEALTVSFLPIDESARHGADYRLSSGLSPGSLTFAPGETEKSIPVEIIDDGLFQGYEAYRSFSVRLVGPNLAAAREYRVFIFNEDLRRGRAQFDTAATSVVASAGRAVLTVRRVEGTEGDLRFSFATADGTGRAGRDYAARSGQFTLANGAAGTAIEIPLMSNGSVDADRTFTMTLSGDSLGTPATSTVTVTHRSSVTSSGGRRSGGGGTSPLALLALAAVLGLRTRGSRGRSADAAKTL